MEKQAISKRFVFHLLLVEMIYVLTSTPSLLASSTGLKWVRVNLPQYRKPGEMVQLQCDYDLGNDTLYAVKWYKGNEEFFRFVPKERPQTTSHKVDGVDVDNRFTRQIQEVYLEWKPRDQKEFTTIRYKIDLSGSRTVVLRSANLRTGGLYRCEVSAEAPSFASAQSEARMEIISLPSENPVITGVQLQYQIGDEISLNCTSGKSFPSSTIHWYINDNQIKASELILNYPMIYHRHGLLSTVQGLKFTLGPNHFQRGSMRVKCVALVSPLWSDISTPSSPSIVHNLPMKDHREALLLVKSTASHVIFDIRLPSLLLLINIIFIQH